MSELKVYEEMEDFLGYEADTPTEMYDKSEADKVIAEKDKEIAELQKQVHDYAQGLYVIQARAEKEARHHKYKRCMAMVKECVNGEYKLKRVKMRDMNNHQFWQFDTGYWKKWHKRWITLADKYKEGK